MCVGKFSANNFQGRMFLTIFHNLIESSYKNCQVNIKGNWIRFFFLWKSFKWKIFLLKILWDYHEKQTSRYFLAGFEVFKSTDERLNARKLFMLKRRRVWLDSIERVFPLGSFTELNFYDFKWNKRIMFSE